MSVQERSWVKCLFTSPSVITDCGTLYFSPNHESQNVDALLYCGVKKIVGRTDIISLAL